MLLSYLSVVIIATKLQIFFESQTFFAEKIFSASLVIDFFLAAQNRSGNFAAKFEKIERNVVLT